MCEVYSMNDQQLQSCVSELDDTAGFLIKEATLKWLIEKCVNEDRAARQNTKESPDNNAQQPKQYMCCPECGNESFVWDIVCNHCGRVQWA